MAGVSVAVVVGVSLESLCFLRPKPSSFFYHPMLFELLRVLFVQFWFAPADRFVPTEA